MVRVLSRSTSLATASVVVAVALVGGAAPALASPNDVPQDTVKVDCAVTDPTTGACQVAGVVYAVAQIGGTTYIGGSFTSVGGVKRSNVAAVKADGNLDLDWNPGADGVVYALAASADGSKVFLGGGFTTVGGQPRGRLAAVSAATGALVDGWTTTTSNNLVRALATDADRLYVGGSFGRIGGKAVPRLAAVSQDTGAVDTSFAPRPSGTVRAVTLSDDGNKVYAGGPFTAVSNVARPGVVELTREGKVTPFAPTDGGVVISMDVSPEGRLFFGTTSNRTWAYDPADPIDPNVPEYRLRTGGDVQAILATSSEVYIGGHFNTIPEQKLERVALASFRPNDGTVTPWNPGANGPFGVWALGLTGAETAPGTALSVGGDFTRVAGLARRGFTRFAF